MGTQPGVPPVQELETTTEADRTVWGSLAMTLFALGYQLGWLAGRLGVGGPDITASPAAGGPPLALVEESPTPPAISADTAAPARRGWFTPPIVGWALFLLGLAVYAYTRLVRLPDFPIYFFTDEAIHPVQGLEMISRGWRDTQGRLFPPYFQNGQYWNLSLSVYLHGIVARLFGETVAITRATSALVSLSAAVAVGLALKWVYRAPFWWASVLVLATMPAWFMHTRTAFEAILMVSFYAWFLFFYLLYRTRSPLFLFPALLFGAFTFYSYANGQAVMAVSGVLLLLSDLRYHLKHWRVGVVGLVVIGVLALPYLRFRSEQPQALALQLRILDSYLFDHELSAAAKLGEFARQYTGGLAPSFWFLPSDSELIRHRWPGQGFLSIVTLPFWLIGVGLALWRFRESEYRVPIIATLAAPFGAALAEVSLLRVLAFVVPAAMLITLGINWLFTFRLSRVLYAVGTASVLLAGIGGSLWLTHDALDNGPTWYDNYGLYGMQWGTQQLFGEAIPAYLAAHPDAHIYLSPNWANGTDIFQRYFLPNEKRLEITNIDGWISDPKPLTPNSVFIMLPDEVDRANASRKFKPLQVEQAIPYPDGKPGFVITRPQYVDNVAAIFAAEKEARRQLVPSRVTVNGETVTVNHSVLGSGQAKDLFDGDTFTLVRFREANPAVIEIVYPTPRAVTSLGADFGSMDFALTVSLYPPGSDTPTTVTQTYRGLPADPHIDLPFANAPPQVERVRIEVKDLNQGDTAQIHVRELALR